MSGSIADLYNLAVDPGYGAEQDKDIKSLSSQSLV